MLICPVVEHLGSFQVLTIAINIHLQVLVWACVFVACMLKSLQSCPDLCDPLDVAHQAPLSMGFSRQEYWSGSPCPPPVDLSDPGIKPASLKSPALAGNFFTTSASLE